MAQGQKTGGRKAGTPNRTTALLKEAILQAAQAAGGDGNGTGGLVGYLTTQARENPAAFMTLLGKVLPLQVAGDDGGPLEIKIIRFADVDPKNEPAASPQQYAHAGLN